MDTMYRIAIGGNEGAYYHYGSKTEYRTDYADQTVGWCDNDKDYAELMAIAKDLAEEWNEEYWEKEA